MHRKIISTAPLINWVEQELTAEFELQIVADTQKRTLVSSMDSEVTAIIVPGPLLIDAEVMDAAPNLRIIARTGVGFDTVDIDAATERKIPVTYTPGSSLSSCCRARGRPHPVCRQDAPHLATIRPGRQLG